MVHLKFIVVISDFLFNEIIIQAYVLQNEIKVYPK